METLNRTARSHYVLNPFEPASLSIAPDGIKISEAISVASISNRFWKLSLKSSLATSDINTLSFYHIIILT